MELVFRTMIKMSPSLNNQSTNIYQGASSTSIIRSTNCHYNYSIFIRTLVVPTLGYLPLKFRRHYYILLNGKFQLSIVDTTVLKQKIFDLELLLAPISNIIK